MLNIRSLWRSIPLSFLLLAPALIWQDTSTSELSGDHDLLVYSIYDYDQGTSLFLYDPAADEHTQLFEIDERLNFEVSPSGRITVSNDGEILLFNAVSPDQAPVNLSQDLGLSSYPLGWSHDGRYLALSSYEDPAGLFIYIWDSRTGLASNITPDNMPASVNRYHTYWSRDHRYLAFWSFEDPGSLFIYVWDSETGLATNIMPDNILASVSGYHVYWYQDGRLTFTPWFGLEDGSSHIEIYLWDGISTSHRGLNLADAVHSLRWNAAGQLVVLSESDGKFHLMLWDDDPSNLGDPNINAFTEVAPGIIDYYSSPTWSPEGNIIFLSQTYDDTHVQIYEWDGQTATDISQNPDLHNGVPSWSRDGRLWAFATFFSSEQLLYVRDENDETILTTEGYSPAWSSDSTLIYCWRAESIGWDLHLWNGQAINTIAHGDEIFAQWQSGQRVVCSSG